MKLSLFFLAVLLAYAAAECSVTVKQTLGSAWTSNGQAYSQWNAQLVAGSEAVTSVTLSITGGDLEQLWELVKEADGSYRLPDYRIQNGGIVAGQVHQFGYIIKTSAQATITVTAKSCGSSSPSASPAAPSASASPAAPSASASPAAPSPSSSAGPIVSTPQPSPAQGCAAKAALVARSEAQGGKWDDGAFSFQIYDLTINNAGNKPINGAQLTFTLASGTSISQWWELNQVSAAVFNVAFNYGNLQVGASQGAGVVERYAKGTTPDAPTVALGSVTCA